LTTFERFSEKAQNEVRGQTVGSAIFRESRAQHTFNMQISTLVAKATGWIEATRQIDLLDAKATGRGLKQRCRRRSHSANAFSLVIQ
jgi:hypothetical protein